MDTRECTRCGERKPWPDAFAKAGGGKRKPHCKPCEADRVAGRPAKRRPGALALVLPLPAGSAPPAAPEGPVAPVRSRTMRDEVQAFVDALDPPVGPADRPLVAAAFRVADLIDDSLGQDGEERRVNTSVATLIRLQRELLGTRAARAQAAPPAQAPSSRFDAFRDAL